ncbi:MAG: hypothetical protein DRJ61_13465 [Acidobacteria bacterium]|nr:MAG: hypothetical protein DRJ61_13465 [Acidobacteriota bacterium]
MFEDLAGIAPVRCIEGRNASKADVLFYETNGVRVAVKTYGVRGFLIRHTLGRWLIFREARAYEEAGEVNGLPAFLGRSGPFALATEWVDAEPLSSYRGVVLKTEIFDRLAGILDELHDRGVALGDLHHRDVLLNADGELYVIDLATAWVLGARPWPFRRFLFRRFCQSDRVSLARMRARFTGGDVEEAAISVGEVAATWHRRGRKVKGWLDRLRGKRR